jgi:hypothetical protein
MVVTKNASLSDSAEKMPKHAQSKGCVLLFYLMRVSAFLGSF